MRFALWLGALGFLCASAAGTAACSSDDGGAKPRRDAGAADTGNVVDSGDEEDARKTRDAGKDTGDPDDDASVEPDADSDADPDVDTPPPTWTMIYTSYIAPGTPGHCSVPSCHGGTRSDVFSCMSKNDCYNGLVAKGLIDTGTPSASALIDPSISPLWWFNPSANPGMPNDDSSPNAAGAADIEAWVLDGALNN